MNPHIATGAAEPAPPDPDVKAFDLGSTLLVQVRSEAAEAWLADNLVGNNTWRRCPFTRYGEVVVEPRYGPPLLRGMTDAGLTVHLDGRFCDG